MQKNNESPVCDKLFTASSREPNAELRLSDGTICSFILATTAHFAAAEIEVRKGDSVFIEHHVICATMRWEGKIVSPAWLGNMRLKDYTLLIDFFKRLNNLE